MNFNYSRASARFSFGDKNQENPNKRNNELKSGILMQQSSQKLKKKGEEKKLQRRRLNKCAAFWWCEGT